MGSAEVAVPLAQVENISTLVSRAWTSPVPERYVHPGVQVIGATRGKVGEPLPLIDLAGLRSGNAAAREEIARQIGSAAGKLGFFHVVNHGIPEEKLAVIFQHAESFFNLPVDVKERALDSSDPILGYNGRFSGRATGVPWLEYLAHWYRPTPQLEAVAEKIWPGGNPTFCNVVREFCESTESLAMELLEVLAESLGLKGDTFSKEFQDTSKYKSSWRLQHYPVCPDSSRCLGAPAHSDTGVLTILNQDTTGGLQVWHGDGFLDVTPIPGALVVNIGDTLQAWSNGRFRSSEHRVVVNGRAERKSVVMLLGGPLDFLVQSPPELVDDAHPSLYVPFTHADYRANFLKLVQSGAAAGRRDSLAFALRARRHDQDSK